MMRKPTPTVRNRRYRHGTKTAYTGTALISPEMGGWCHNNGYRKERGHAMLGKIFQKSSRGSWCPLMTNLP